MIDHPKVETESYGRATIFKVAGRSFILWPTGQWRENKLGGEIGHGVKRLQAVIQGILDESQNDGV